MLSELKKSLTFEKKNLDTVITNKINDEGLKLDTRARDLDLDICSFQRKKDDYLMELSTNITTDQEERYYKKVTEKIDFLKYELKEKKNHYCKLKDQYENDKRKIDIKMKRVQDDYKRITRENAALEQDAKKGMSDLKWLQESIKELKKRKIDKTVRLDNLKSQIYGTAGGNGKGRVAGLDLGIPEENGGLISEDAGYYSSYRHHDNSEFKG